MCAQRRTAENERGAQEEGDWCAATAAQRSEVGTVVCSPGGATVRSSTTAQRSEVGVEVLVGAAQTSMPTTCSTKCLKRVNSPAQRRGDCMQRKPTNQTNLCLARLIQCGQPNNWELAWLEQAKAALA